jgi:hypothetical protein
MPTRYHGRHLTRAGANEKRGRINSLSCHTIVNPGVKAQATSASSPSTLHPYRWEVDDPPEGLAVSPTPRRESMPEL